MALMQTSQRLCVTEQTGRVPAAACQKWIWQTEREKKKPNGIEKQLTLILQQKIKIKHHCRQTDLLMKPTGLWENVLIFKKVGYKGCKLSVFFKETIQE